MVVYGVTMMALMMGLNVGYGAATADDAYADFNGTHFDAGGNVSEINATESADEPVVDYERVVPWALNIETPADPYIRSASLAVAGVVVQVAMFYAATVANVAATIGYYISPWVPIDWLATVLEGMNMLAIAGFGYGIYIHYRDIYGGLVR